MIEGEAGEAGTPSATNAPRVSSLRAWLASTYATPIVVFLLLRWTMAGFFLWGAINKAPWNNWGCVAVGQPGYSPLAPGDCFTAILKGEAAGMPFGFGNVITQYVLPNVTGLEWFAFVLELTLTITLAVGILTRFFALVGTLWAAFVSAQYVWFFRESFPDTVLFFLVPLFLVTIRGGGLLTVDHRLRPRLANSRSRIARRLARWMF